MPLTPGLLVSRKQRDIRGGTSLMVGEGFVDKKINQGSLPGRPENLKKRGGNDHEVSKFYSDSNVHFQTRLIMVFNESPGANS